MRPLNILHTKNPGYKIGMLVKNPRYIKIRMNKLTFTPDTLDYIISMLHQNGSEKIHVLGMKALVWTENEQEDMKQHLAMGVDGIITDYPARAVKVMEGNKG